MGEPLLELRGVRHDYESVASAGRAAVLAGVNLELGAGEALAVVGPSGSGKSTLLYVIGGLLRPTAGEVLLGGRDLARMGADDLARMRNAELGFVFQAHHLLPQCTALENVLVPALVCVDQRKRAAAPARARALLERVGLGARLHHRPAQLSGGECQRVALVRALLLAPRLLLADEPPGSLDSESARGVADLLFDLEREEGAALIAVTHSSELAERMAGAGRVLRMRDGRLEPMGSPA
jgi:lipoprotein-releasing system ATP-binding protein